MEVVPLLMKAIGWQGGSILALQTLKRVVVARNRAWDALVAQGLSEGNIGGPNDGEGEVEFPEDVVVRSIGNHIHLILSTVYPSFENHLNDPSYFQDKAILVPTNEEFDATNDCILGFMKDEGKTYISSNFLFEIELPDFFEESIYSSVVLNGLKASRISNHKLTLKIGVPVMLLRNIEQTKRLCNGTRLHIVRIGRHIIEA
ncbi:uncharacterized protein LOC111895130 [Lactuca sativa]|uniref:uncharacterized protein LOC111895130 n=1 Tax=Lactuca sativa TaxID=4236 RepID=UPI000CD9DF8E|nr:uncharacterized protein LOC111895130 [Lactuca sativa]